MSGLPTEFLPTRKRLYCESRGLQRFASYAARFAGKEAVLKALGTGLSGGEWQEIEILPDGRGLPIVQLYGYYRELASQKGVSAIHISLYSCPRVCSRSGNHVGRVLVMKVAKAVEMREIDRRTINEFGIPGLVLMENAGAAVARKVVEVLGCPQDKKVSIFAGTGNNGGDGFVVARYLRNQGVKVKVFLAGDKEQNMRGCLCPACYSPEN